MENLTQWLQPAIKAALEAGREIMDVYSGSDFGVSEKADHSPLTLADKRADLRIRSVLKNTPFPVLSEESGSHEYHIRGGWDSFWLVDPLDGTKEFISRNDEFTVNIALIRRDKPVLGVIFLPVFNQLFFGADNNGAWRTDNASEITGINVNPEDLKRLGTPLPETHDNVNTIMVSRSHLSAATATFISKLGKKTGSLKKVTAGSSLKLCRIAEGSAGIYPRLGPTMEWDIAAGVAIITSSGGKVVTPGGLTLRFNKKDMLNPWFIAVSEAFLKRFPDYREPGLLL